MLGGRSSTQLGITGTLNLRSSIRVQPDHSPAAMQVFGRRTAGALQAAARRQSYSTTTSGYAATAENLRINKDTKVIYQGFTGKQGR